MRELPADLERLRVIRLYLGLQLDGVDAKIREVEVRQEWKDVPAPPRRERSLGQGGVGWRLQHVPDGGSVSAVVHRGDCPKAAGGWLSRSELDIALKMPEVSVCLHCRPDRAGPTF
ncbi:DUF6233 domain-containing protein [Streptomyces sp. PA03-6a]|nr:DUF6233 domain-containing protein [Streptomyces sp. PA03-6a]